MEELTQACDPASFGVNEKDVLDETYRKAGKIDPERFASNLDPVQTDLMKIIRGHLLEGTQSTKHIIAKLHKLNVYSMHVIFIRPQRLIRSSGKGSFFKPHIDTPRGAKMFGSLVVVFPTPHEGGALHLRHRGQEWVFDSGRELTALHQPSIGYVTFFSDVEHEVAPVTSGHRVTLTYNLYFDNGPGYSKCSATEHLSLPPPVNENAFRELFQGLLENPEFLANGGTLAFGLRHVYPIRERFTSSDDDTDDDDDHDDDDDTEDDDDDDTDDDTDDDDGKKNPTPLKLIYGALKGSDAVVYQTARALGFQPMLYMYYEWRTPNGLLEGAVIDEVIDFNSTNQWSSMVDITNVVLEKGGIVVYQDHWGTDGEYENPEAVEWVTPVTAFNRKESKWATYGNEPMLEVAYADLCLFVRIGKVGERLVYPSASQLEKERQRGIRASDVGSGGRWSDY